MNKQKRAVELRKLGKTYSEIKREIGGTVPKSTLSYWCRNTTLNTRQKNRINSLRLENIKIAQKKATITHRNKRKEYLANLKEKHRHLADFLLDDNIAKLLLAMLYLGEGAKWKSHRGLQLGSSNPKIMEVYLKLLERCFGVSRKNLKAIIYHRADQDLDLLIRYWSRALRMPKNCFYTSKPDLRTKGRKTRNDYYGVCAVFGPNTEIQLELEIIAELFSQI